MTTKRLSLLTVLLWMLAIGWVAVLFFFSGQNAAESGRLSVLAAEFLLRAFNLPWTMEEFVPVLRKLAHFGIFAIEGFLLGLALLRSLHGRGIAVPISFAACAVMAAANEYHQSFSEGRSCEFRDVLIDSGGALLGVLAAWALLWLFGRCRRQN